jgi:hypothetical protein
MKFGDHKTYYELVPPLPNCCNLIKSHTSRSIDSTDDRNRGKNARESNAISRKMEIDRHRENELQKRKIDKSSHFAEINDS